MIFITPLKEVVETSVDSEHLDCDNETITAGENAACLVVDLALPVFIATVFAAGSSFFYYRLGG
jgi:hypothetical protein